MKKKLILILTILSLSVSSIFAGENILRAFEKSYKEENLTVCLSNALTKLNVKMDKPVPQDRLNAINFILKHTYENYIHKMRGEEDNKVYTKETGQEAVYDKNGKLVTNEWNKGSFNYGTYDKPIYKFEVDIFPWLIWGNSEIDPTSFPERFYYYIMDLDMGIQEYVFLEDKSELEQIDYESLSELDKMVYKFFEYLLFNKSYKNTLSEKHIVKYKMSAENYWEYLSQLLKLAGYEEENK